MDKFGRERIGLTRFRKLTMTIDYVGGEVMPHHSDPNNLNRSLASGTLTSLKGKYSYFGRYWARDKCLLQKFLRVVKTVAVIRQTNAMTSQVRQIITLELKGFNV